MKAFTKLIFLLGIVVFLLYLNVLAFTSIDSETRFINSLIIFRYPIILYWYVPLTYSFLFYQLFISIRNRIRRRRTDKAYQKLLKRGTVI